MTRSQPDTFMRRDSAPGRPPIRVLIAEDHETVREGLLALFASVPEVVVVDAVGDTDAAIARAREVELDVILVDLSIPPAGGLAAIRALKAEHPDIAQVVLTRYDDPAFLREAMKAGASAYVLKQSAFVQVREAIRRVVRGERYLDPAFSVALDDDTLRAGTETVATPREHEVLRRTARGESNKHIAAVLGISVRTVEAHKANGMRRLGIEDRSALVRYATMQGWMTEP